MVTKLREMTWDMHAFHAFLFALGVVAMIVFAIHRDNPKKDMDPALLIVVGVAFMASAIASFLMCLFDKEEGKYSPKNPPDQEHEKLTAAH